MIKMIITLISFKWRLGTSRPNTSHADTQSEAANIEIFSKLNCLSLVDKEWPARVNIYVQNVTTCTLVMQVYRTI